MVRVSLEDDTDPLLRREFSFDLEGRQRGDRPDLEKLRADPAQRPSSGEREFVLPSRPSEL
jgi:hypothetical protein